MQPRTVLIVDDEGLWRALLLRLFTYYGYKVLLASSCASGMDVLKQNSIDCAVLDLNLRDGSGDIICAAIRERDGGMKTPVILFTFDAEAGRFLSGEHRANLVVAKDIPLLDLPKRLEELFTGVRM